uniref:Tubulin polyglutamylase complex subunit 2 n=1 Tax=Ursus maritimus TaxID=29073 RepID=A0A452T3L0_URSMA
MGTTSSLRRVSVDAVVLTASVSSSILVRWASRAVLPLLWLQTGAWRACPAWPSTYRNVDFCAIAPLPACSYICCPARFPSAVASERERAVRYRSPTVEKKNNCMLPEDVKNFYLMTNGFHMTWSVKLDEHTIPLGSMAINSISKLTQLNQSSVYSLPNAPTLADLEDDALEDSENQPEKPHFDSRSVIFELDPCNGNGKVCLVYKRGKPALAQDTEIWFLDRALYWHFLTDTFTAYYRLLITHLGLPQWQYAFTSYGISPQAKQWFNMYKPITYNTDLLAEETNSFVNKLDPSRVFKSKNKTLIPKKKGPAQPAGGQKGPPGPPSTSKSSSSPGNPVRK